VESWCGVEFRTLQKTGDANDRTAHRAIGKMPAVVPRYFVGHNIGYCRQGSKQDGPWQSIHILQQSVSGPRVVYSGRFLHARAVENS
jgi:hypothetical protein